MTDGAGGQLAADKALCKLALVGLGVPTPRWCRPGEDPAWFLARYGQVMVKPRMGGSSVGMSLVSRSGDLDAAISQAATTDGLEPVLEEYVAGDSVTVGLLQLPAEVIVLPPLATRPRHAAFYDARAKMDPHGEGLVAYEAAALPAGDDQLLRDFSLRIWHGTGCAGMARIDYIVGPSGPLALEVNTVPGLAQGSNFITAASLAGITYPDVILALLHEALHRPQPDIALPAPRPGDLTAPQEGPAAR
jgi:D-alanine-D-alanine ligase